MFKNIYKKQDGFSLTELMVVLVIIGVLVLLALPRLMPVVNKAKATEAKLSLKQVYMLEKAYKFEYDKYSNDLSQIGFEQEKLITENGTARYIVEIKNAEIGSFLATATSVVDFDGDGGYNVWEVKEDGIIMETTPD
ncbi:MAG: prepilin-type N-terminal cleavage/methylation domain-containing protein [Ignavibacteriae bacterium]|nr:prepilin-type N-terminal cleavage/methylation domain-containing protein [Ignavibacteriota bacterium]